MNDGEGQSGRGTRPGLDGGENRGEKLPKRDWLLLGLLSLFTIILLAGGTEMLARRMFSESKAGVDPCMVFNDASTGVRGVPNSVCWEKSPENPPIEFRFNSCGHRAGVECCPKAAGAFRIVMIGSSVAMGERVQREESFATRLPVELTRRTGHTVELYNESMGFGFSHSTTLRFNDVLTAEPDVILWVLTPMDIERASLVLPTADLDPWAGLSLRAKAWQRLRSDFASKSMTGAVSDVFNHTRNATLLRHYLYGSQSQYVKSFLMGPDHETGYLKSAPSEEWRNGLRQFDSDAADMEGRARAAGVPFVAVLVPERAQAAMISMGEWPAGYDPYKLGEEVRTIIASHGGTYVDILPEFRAVPNPEQYYYPVDGHPNPAGHALIAAMLTRGLTGGAVPALSGDGRPQVMLEPSK